MDNESIGTLPGEGCFVSHKEKGRYSGQLGVVVKVDNSSQQVHVMWGQGGEKEWHGIGELKNGFRAGHVVQDRPRSNTRKTLGLGVVLAHRAIAGREMVLVQLHRTGESRWLPFERLVRVRNPEWKFTNAVADVPESFRLKILAHALESWNQTTGALDRLDVDPLPHQIDLVHRIMTSDHANWLIADDVGLGKTIEAGLLLAAMKRRHRTRRVLIVCPAGVVRQWQDEMQYKFGEDFRIYGVDFNIRQAGHWDSFDQVIVSIDRAKSEEHSTIFRDSRYWDVILIDEAHHLSKTEGSAVTQRYRLAQTLQKLTDSLIFLTGTPHQGKTDQFLNVLSLLRPDLRSRFSTVYTDPSVVAEVVLRNRKSQVTDASGNFIFRGQDTKLIDVPMSTDAIDFDTQLRSYLRHGYAASEAGGVTGRAVGFVMTTYRKLASSSIAAIEKSLERRRDRLARKLVNNNNSLLQSQFKEIQQAFEEGEDGEDELDKLSDEVSSLGAGVDPFFANELQMLDNLCELAKLVRKNDLKLKKFLVNIVDTVHKKGLKLLVFTEYRATQKYITDAMNLRYTGTGVCLIHGGMSLNEKRKNIDRFNGDAQFLISTEAGGEGINLHYNCHILVNYDLPWNPRRLVQRAGRLYRYGQTERVVVFNLISRDSFDNKALGILLDRVSAIARDMSDVSSEYHEGIETEIIGDILERVDIAQILANNKEMKTDRRSEEEIHEAIERAEKSKTRQEELFARIEGYDPNTSTVFQGMGPESVLSFLEGILPLRGIIVRDRLYNGRLLELELPEDLQGIYSEFGNRTVVRTTIDRRLALKDERNVSMDFESVFFTDLVEYAKSPEFGGEHAMIESNRDGVVGIYKLRWQNDQGLPRWEMLVPVFLNSKDDLAITDSKLYELLLQEPVDLLKDSPTLFSKNDRKNILDKMRDCAEKELSKRCTSLRHPNDIVLLASATLLRSSKKL